MVHRLRSQLEDASSDCKSGDAARLCCEVSPHAQVVVVVRHVFWTAVIATGREETCLGTFEFWLVLLRVFESELLPYNSNQNTRRRLQRMGIRPRG